MDLIYERDEVSVAVKAEVGWTATKWKEGYVGGIGGGVMTVGGASYVWSYEVCARWSQFWYFSMVVCG